MFQLVKIRARDTFNSSATPEIGSNQCRPSILARVDLEALKNHIAATIEKVKRDDPKALRTRLTQVERELREELSAKKSP